MKQNNVSKAILSNKSVKNMAKYANDTYVKIKNQIKIKN